MKQYANDRPWSGLRGSPEAETLLAFERLIEAANLADF